METILHILAGVGLYYAYNYLWDLLFGDDSNQARNTVFFLILICLLLGSCKSKPKPAPTPPVVIYADTTRIKLKREVDLAGNVVITLSQKADSTLSKHKKTVQQYDAIQFTLP